MRNITVFGIISALLWTASPASAEINILIDQPEEKRFPIAVERIYASNNYEGKSRMLKDISKVIRQDLERSAYFYVISPSIYNDKSKAFLAQDMPWSSWRIIGAEGLVKGLATTHGGRTTVELRLFDTKTQRMQVGKVYTFDNDDWRTIAHRFADEILHATTGVRGPFATQIAYTVQTKRSKKRGRKQIFVMDSDGHQPRQITKNTSFNLGASWSPDGRELTFTSYAAGFPDIYVAELESGHIRRLTNNRSTNITPAFSPDGGSIAYSSGQGSDMEIYLMSNRGAESLPFAPAFGLDLAPVFSPNGEHLLFSSERGGRLHLYKKALYEDGPATRLTFAGSQNDSADWSPDGTRIVFTRFFGQHYQIFTINPDGSNIRQLTFHGSNEHPRWSPDSRYITFSKTIAKKTHVYMMRFDGANKTILTEGKNASLPDWGPWPADY